MINSSEMKTWFLLKYVSFDTAHVGIEKVRHHTNCMLFLVDFNAHFSKDLKYKMNN